MTFHVWPKHGRPRVRPVTDATITKLDFVHGGEALDFRLPQEVIAHKTANAKIDQGFITLAGMANAIGVAKTHRFALTFFPAARTIPEVQQETRAIAKAPYALASPEWMTRSGVFGPLHPHDPKNFPAVEAMLAQAGKIIPRLNHLGGCYGMWIYGQQHTDYNYWEHRWDIYRLLSQLHHNGPLWPWIMWIRSGDPDYLDFALANTRAVADTGFCHHSRPEFEALPWPKGKWRGGLTDYKGLVPWNSGDRVPDYNSLSSFLLWNYYLTGDGWMREVALEWGEAAKRRGPHSFGRSASGTTRATLDLYSDTWDTGLIPIYRRTTEAHLTMQLPSGAFAEWSSYTPWVAEYLRFTGSESARQVLLKWADAYMDGYGDVPSNSSGYGTYIDIPASAYFASGDLKYARESRGLLEYWLAGMCDDPESQWRGNYPGEYAREMSFFGQFLSRAPLVLAAWAQAGKDIPPLHRRPFVPAKKAKDGIRQMEILLLGETDRPINVELVGILLEAEPAMRYRSKSDGKDHVVYFQLYDTDGKLLRAENTTVRQSILEHVSKNIEICRHKWWRFQIPADGLKGVYRLVLGADDTDFSVRLPVSDVKEMCKFGEAGKWYMWEGWCMLSFYRPKADTPVEVDFIAQAQEIPATVQILDPGLQVVDKIHPFGQPALTAAEYLWTPLRYRKVRPAQPGEGAWTVFGGVAPPTNVIITVGGKRPEWFSVWPERAFDPAAYGVGERK
jgi:hypothetical protein